MISNPKLYTPSFPEGGAQVSLQQSVHTHTDGFLDDIESSVSSPTDVKCSPVYAI